MAIGSQNPMNLSDHIEVALHTNFAVGDELQSSSMNMKELEKRKPPNQRIKWSKCDLEFYCSVLEGKFDALETRNLETHLDADLLVNSIYRALHDASVASTPTIRDTGRQRKKKLPIWNDDISMVVERSKPIKSGSWLDVLVIITTHA